jgi:hypothetical protein
MNEHATPVSILFSCGVHNLNSLMQEMVRVCKLRGRSS